MMRVLQRFLDRIRGLETGREPGQALVEYAMIILFVVIACVGALTAFGGAQVGRLWNPIQDEIVNLLTGG